MSSNLLCISGRARVGGPEAEVVRRPEQRPVQCGHRPRRFIGGRPRLRRHGKGDHPAACRSWWHQRCRCERHQPASRQRPAAAMLPAADAASACAADRTEHRAPSLRPQAPAVIGVRAAVGVPLLREGIVVGILSVIRTEPRPSVRSRSSCSHLRRPGGDCDRERAAIRRNPGQEPAAGRGERA